MYGQRRNSEAAQRMQDRRRRQDDAARLSVEIPRLETLRLELADEGPGMSGSVSHVRPVVVTSAPALFELPCSNHYCKDGGHDVTWEVMRALRGGLTRFEGQHTCNGSVGTSECAHVLKYVGIATYRP
jgi:hypothetical protein